MNHYCDACHKLLETGTAHADLVLLSEVTGSKIFKCQKCKTYMHFVLGVWEVFMATPSTYRKPSEPRSDPLHRHSYTN